MIDELDYAQRLIDLERQINELHAQIRNLETTLTREREVHMKIAELANKLHKQLQNK